MDVVALLSATLLALMGLLHLYWAFGGTLWLERALPTKEGQRLIEPGRALTLFVGLLLFCFAYVAYALHFGTTAIPYLRYAGWFLAVLFLLRAVGDFNAVGFFKKISGTPFATYDRLFYSPLCLALSAAFALLAYRA